MDAARVNTSYPCPVLILGANGQLGMDCRALLGERALGLGRPGIDLADAVETRRVLDRYRPAVVVNCAAYTGVDACETDPACWPVNAEGPATLAAWAAENGAFLVHISTDYVFSGDKPPGQCWVETDVPSPRSVYGRTKLAGEQAVLASGAQAAILRTAWLYGAHGHNFLKTMLRRALHHPERTLRVVNDQFGSPTWSRTLARQIAAVIDARACGLFHATAEGACSWYDLALRFLTRMELPFRLQPCSTAEYPTAARRPANSVLENAALKWDGLNRFPSWEEDLDRFVDTCRAPLLKEASEEHPA